MTLDDRVGLPDHLRPGASYRVLRELRGVPPGGRVTFTARRHYPKDGGTRYEFADNIDLWDQMDADCEVLGSLHLFLAPES